MLPRGDTTHVMVGVAVGWLVVTEIAARLPHSPVAGISLIRSFSTVISRAAYLVPSAFALVLVCIVQAMTGPVSENVWSVRGGQFGNLLTIVIVAACVAGQIGMLEAARAKPGSSPGPDEFLAGIRRHTFTIVVGKLLLTFLVAIASARAFGRLDGMVPYVVLALPTLLLAPLIGTVSLHPGRPVRAIMASVAAAIRHPGRTVLLVGLQFCTYAAATSALTDFVSSRSGHALLAIANGSPLGFQLVPFVHFVRFEDGRGLTVLMTVLGSVFLTSYWSIVHPPEPRPAAQRNDAQQPSP